MRGSKNPGIGAVLNIVLFGAADLYRGKRGSAILKFLFGYLRFFMIGFLLVDLTDRYIGGQAILWVQFVLSWIYIVIAGLLGYKTVTNELSNRQE